MIRKPHAVVTLDDVHEDALALDGPGRQGRCAPGVRNWPAAQDRCAGLRSCSSVSSAATRTPHRIVSNPLAGATSDLLVDLGATTVIGETLEWLGAEHVLARRAASKVVGDAIEAAVQRREASAAATG